MTHKHGRKKKRKEEKKEPESKVQIVRCWKGGKGRGRSPCLLSSSQPVLYLIIMCDTEIKPSRPTHSTCVQPPLSIRYTCVQPPLSTPFSSSRESLATAEHSVHHSVGVDLSTTPVRAILTSAPLLMDIQPSFGDFRVLPLVLSLSPRPSRASPSSPSTPWRPSPPSPTPSSSPRDVCLVFPHLSRNKN